ncbi:YicC/YloC family endoribonuclease [Thermodesulfobacteriota bacterium]
MIKSMTAYGRGENELSNIVFVAEVKSLNNRYRDIILRLPRGLQVLEDEVRSHISSRVRRGRIEVSIQAEKKGEEINQNLALNLPLVKSYLDIFKRLSDEFGLDDKIRPEFFIQIKDAIIMKPGEMDLDESRSGIQEVIVHALDSLDSMKIQEGKAIEEDIIKRLMLIDEYLNSIDERSPTVVKDYKVRLKDRIENISEDINLDEGRLMQEVAIFAGRCDITEEIVRARSHLVQFRDYMSRDDSIGRRLDFLTQEISREINTISAKASDSFISANAVEIKAELEKIREQIQNVE